MFTFKQTFFISSHCHGIYFEKQSVFQGGQGWQGPIVSYYDLAIVN